MATLEEIAPGSRISLKVVKHPTNTAATKTLVRLLSKDREVQRENDRHRRVRKTTFTQNQRGGRFWDVNVVKQQPVKGAVGESGTITATLDVLRDLRSVSRFIDINPA